MTESEFKLIARYLDRVVIFRSAPSEKWEVLGYQDDNPTLRNRVRSARQEARPFASVDTALRFIRSAGYAGEVTIDEAGLQSPQKRAKQ